MEVSDAERQFAEAARLHGSYMKKREFEATIPEYDKIVSALRVLRTSPNRGQRFLLTCLDDPDPSVVTWAALYLLDSKEKEAVKALERVARSDAGLVGLGAETTLEEWRAGRLKIE